MEEVGLAQVGGRLLLEVRPAQARSDPVEIQSLVTCLCDYILLCAPSNNHCTSHVEARSHSFNAKAINLVPDCYAIFAEFMKESGFN